MENKIRNYYKNNKVFMQMRIRAWRRKHIPSFSDQLFDRAAKFAETCLEAGDKKGYEQWLMHTPKSCTSLVLYKRRVNMLDELKKQRDAAEAEYEQTGSAESWADFLELSFRVAQLEEQ